MQAVTVFVICGGCRIGEGTRVMVVVDMVEDYDVEIFLRIPDSGTKVAKLYSISDEYAEIVRKYLKLRPVRSKTARFFLQYRDGKIAEFLKLPGPEGYNWLSFRTTTFADTSDQRAIGDIFSNKILENKFF